MLFSLPLSFPICLSSAMHWAFILGPSHLHLHTQHVELHLAASIFSKLAILDRSEVGRDRYSPVNDNIV